MNGVSKVKIAAGYTLLLAVLFFSLFFVHREMANLMLSDGGDVQWTDSVLALLHQKDTNTITMLRTLSEANKDVLSPSDIEEAIGRRDSAVKRQRVQRRIISHRDTVVVPPRKRSFFRRLGEVFVPPKKDTTIQVKTSLEYATDTIIDPYNPVDSLHKELRVAVKQRKKANNLMQRRSLDMQRMDSLLTGRIDSLLKEYEQETLQRGRAEAEFRRSVRHRSVRTLASIAAGAVLLSAAFLFVIWRDVARSNRYRHQLEKARCRAEDLLAEREHLMLAITHDFKAPLGSIIGYADLLARLTMDERQRFYLDNMKTSSQHLLKLVVDLLDFHSLALNKIEVSRVSFHPAHLIEEVSISFRPLAEARGLELQCRIAPELDAPFLSDPLRLRQIVDNLLSNAVKFTDKGSINLTASYEDGRMVIAVADTGRGMEPEDRERIFREFTRLPGAQGKDGFGLGLSIVRRLVHLLGGTIAVDSELGRGSTFTVRMPLAVAEGGDVRPQDEQPASPAPPALKRVLLIDDDRIQLALTEAMLAQNGITSVTCLQPDELLDALRTDTFDLLLTDVQMPAISGFDLLQLLRASNIAQAHTIPVMAVTARTDMRRDEFTSLGFAGCLHKPFTMADLLGELTTCLPQTTVTEQGVAPSSASTYSFSALTAFAGDDARAARSILTSFLSETRANARSLRRAVSEKDMTRISALAHKMIPVFTLIGAEPLVTLLRELEARNDQPFSDEAGHKVQIVLSLMNEVVRAMK